MGGGRAVPLGERETVSLPGHGGEGKSGGPQRRPTPEPFSGRERLAHATTAPLCRSTSIGQRFWWGSGQLSWGGGW